MQYIKQHSFEKRNLTMRTTTLFASFTTIASKPISSKLRAICAAAALTVLAATNASAVPVTYIFHGDLAGAINGTAVNGALTIALAASKFRSNRRWTSGVTPAKLAM